MVYNIFAIVFSIVLPIAILIKPIKKAKEEKMKLKSFIQGNKFEIISYFLLVIGCILRSVAIDELPNGLNVDETSSGFEAFSILKYGIDRGGNSYPVHLYAWGSGQSALYSYIMIPFLLIFGLSKYTIRLPMVLIRDYVFIFNVLFAKKYI